MHSELQWYPSMVPVINATTRRNQYFARVSLSYPVSLICVKKSYKLRSRSIQRVHRYRDYET